MIEKYLDKDEKYTILEECPKLIITSKGKIFEENKVLECLYPTRRPNDIDSHSTIWGCDTHVTHHGIFG